MRPVLFALLILPGLAFAAGKAASSGSNASSGQNPTAPGASAEPHGPPSPPHEILIDHAEELGLDDATVSRIQVLADAARADLEARHEALRALRPGDAGFDAAITALMDAERALMEDIAAELTEAQWEAAKEILPPPPPQGRRPGPPPGARSGR